LKRGSSAKEKEKKLRMLSDQKRRVENVNALLDAHLENFDRYRIQKMKVRWLRGLECGGRASSRSDCLVENCERDGSLAGVLPCKRPGAICRPVPSDREAAPHRRHESSSARNPCRC
jgi:hypothetical protein